MSRSRLRLISLLVGLALIAGVAPLSQQLAIATPNPVATDEPSYQAFGRVFPDPQGCLAYGVPDNNADGVKDTPKGVSPWAKGRACADQFLSYQEAIDGARFLQSRFGRFVKVIRLDQAYDNPNYMSAGIPRAIGIDDGKVKVLARDRRPLYIFKVTDSASQVPEKDRHHFAYSLSIHGIERAGIEGGVRAMEDLVTWAACEKDEYKANTPACTAEGPFPKKIVETPTDKPVPTAGQVLENSVLYFVLSNPDGWARGQTAPVEIEDGSPNANYAPGAMFQRFNGNGVDLNRDFPTIGYTYRPYSPGSEPETKAYSDVLSQIRNNTSAGHFTGGLDLHGMITAQAFSYTLLGAGQHDYRKNAITVDTSIRTWQDQTKRLAWSPWIADSNANGQVDSGETAVSEPAFGGRVPAPVADKWGSVIDTLGYQITGGFGDWFDSPLGLDAVGIDNEMYASHIAPNNVFEPALEQTHIDGNKGLIYSQLAALLIEDEIKYEPEGRVGYIYNPKRIQVPAADRLPNPGLPAQNDIEVVLPCQEQAAANLEGSCQGAHFSMEGSSPTLEFNVKGPDEGIWNGGLTAQLTHANGAGVSPGALGNIALEYFDEGQWAQIAVSLTSEGTNYSQAGKIVTVNDPEPGRWRVKLTGAPQMPSRVKIDFNASTAEISPGQAAIDASSMDFFSDLNKYVPEGSQLAPLQIADVASDKNLARQFDSIVVVNNVGSKSYLEDQLGLTPTQADAFFSNLRYYAESGGNLVLTDAALQALNPMGLVPGEAVKKDDTSPAGSFNFSIQSGTVTYKNPDKWPLTQGVDLPGASEVGFVGRRQATEPTPLGYTPHTADRTPAMPIWSVLVPAWNSLCGAEDKKDCSTALVTQNRYANNGSASQPFGQVDLGEIKVGEGRVRIAGELFPDPIQTIDPGNDTRFGLASYALTYTSYIVFENLVDWANPNRLEPRKPPYVTTLAFTESSATNGFHTDRATIETQVLDDLGQPIVGAPLRLELRNPGGIRETVQATSDANGLARFSLNLDELPGEYGVTASFAGNDTYLPSNATLSFRVLPEITLTKVAVSANGSKRTITAALTEDDGPAIIGRTITFFADGVQIGQAKTDKSGVATFRPPAKFNGGKHTYQATFGGDAGYAGSSGEASTT